MRSAAELRRWLEAHHADSTELLIGFYKKSSSKTGIAYAEAVDEALCFGWIDGITRSLDDERWAIRFTPRKRTSIWSVKNTKRVSELIAEGRMAAPGLAAFERRDPKNTHRYSYERRSAELGPNERKVFRANREAWDFLQAQPPSYRRVASWWVISAKKDETRARRLDALVAHSAKGERIPQASSPTRSRARRPAL
jgi:uncharacterized protein YdeI (YjbR/CyaY-like superfamily)